MPHAASTMFVVVHNMSSNRHFFFSSSPLLSLSLCLCLSLSFFLSFVHPYALCIVWCVDVLRWPMSTILFGSRNGSTTIRYGATITGCPNHINYALNDVDALVRAYVFVPSPPPPSLYTYVYPQPSPGFPLPTSRRILLSGGRASKRRVESPENGDGVA